MELPVLVLSLHAGCFFEGKFDEGCTILRILYFQGATIFISAVPDTWVVFNKW